MGFGMHRKLTQLFRWYWRSRIWIFGDRRDRKHVFRKFRTETQLLGTLNLVIAAERKKAQHRILESDHWGHTGSVQIHYLNLVESLVKVSVRGTIGGLPKSLSEIISVLEAGLLIIENQARSD